MLGKLIKHDFKALSRTLFPLQIGILGGGLLITLFTTLNLRFSDHAFSSETASIGSAALVGISTLVSVLIGICIVASALVTLILICMEYYRNLMSSEGYLTFTLPVTTGRILWSKLITGMLWSIINLAVIALTVLIFAVFGTATEGFMNRNVLEGIRDIFTVLPGVAGSVKANAALICAEVLILAIVLLGTMLLHAYFSITVGGRAQKHRLLASIGMYIALSAGINIVATILAVSFSFRAFSLPGLTVCAANGTLAVHGLLWLCILIGAAFGAVFFLGARGILKNRLNLQ